MSVNWPDVAKTQVFEQHAPVQARFDPFLQLSQETFDRIPKHGHPIQHFDNFHLQTGVIRIGS